MELFGTVFRVFNSKPKLDWRTDNSIYSFLLSHVDSNGRLDSSGLELPDPTRQEGGGNVLRYAPGLSDSMFGADESDGSKSTTKKLVKLLSRIAREGRPTDQSEFYEMVVARDSIIGILDNVLQGIVEAAPPAKPTLFNFAHDLAFKTNQKNTVKFGIALLGLCGDPDVLKDLKIFGLHDEFSIFACVAIMNLSDNPVQDLWSLAKKLDGWGKIRIVDRLATMEITAEIKDWLLLEGYQNSIMNEYLAYTCAMAGELHKKIAEANVSANLFKSSREIISALIAGGPAESIKDYPYAEELITHFLLRGRAKIGEIQDFIALKNIESYLNSLSREDGEKTKDEWQPGQIDFCKNLVAELLSSKNWVELTYKALESIDPTEYWDGKQAAAMLQIDIWDIVWKRLLSSPLESTNWFDVTRFARKADVDAIVDLALKTIPLAEITTGPSDSFGFGLLFQKHQSLEYVITYLKDHPGKGLKLIAAGLNSPVTRSRNMTVETLRQWGQAQWNQEIKERLDKLVKIEPNQETLKRVKSLLEGNGNTL